MDKLLELREELDRIDDQIVALYEARMRVCARVADYKIKNGKEVLDRSREEQKLQSVEEKTSNDFNREAVRELYELLMEQSRRLQKKIISEAE